jgi:hypothetical protein
MESLAFKSLLLSIMEGVVLDEMHSFKLFEKIISVFRSLFSLNARLGMVFAESLAIVNQ